MNIQNKSKQTNEQIKTNPKRSQKKTSKALNKPKTNTQKQKQTSKQINQPANKILLRRARLHARHFEDFSDRDPRLFNPQPKLCRKFTRAIGSFAKHSTWVYKHFPLHVVVCFFYSLIILLFIISFSFFFI